MMGTGNPVYLLNVERGERVVAELLDVIAEEQLADWERGGEKWSVKSGQFFQGF